MKRNKGKLATENHRKIFDDIRSTDFGVGPYQLSHATCNSSSFQEIVAYLNSRTNNQAQSIVNRSSSRNTQKQRKKQIWVLHTLLSVVESSLLNGGVIFYHAVFPMKIFVRASEVFVVRRYPLMEVPVYINV